MFLSFDLDPESETAFRALCEEYGITITSYVQCGPGGGCPEFQVIADEKYKVVALTEFYFGKGD